MKHRYQHYLIFIGIISFILQLFLDLTIYEIPIIVEIEPQFSAEYLFRTTIIMLAAFCLIAGVRNTRSNDFNFWNNWGELSWQLQNRSFSVKRAKLTLLFLCISSCFFVLLFWHSPHAYSIYSYEDGFIENSSALLIAGSSVIFIYIARLIRRNEPKNILKLATAITFSLIFLLISLEEISWFQRVFDIPLLSFFENNQQLETNLHNFATDEAELFYYSGSFLFLILLPYMHGHISKLPLPDSLTFFIPSPIIIFCSSIFMAYNYDMWNSLFIQFGFFSTLFIILFYLLEQWRNSKEYRLTAIILSLLIVQQVIYLLLGTEFKREWEVTEYKEFYISISFFLYALEIRAKSIHLAI